MTSMGMSLVTGRALDGAVNFRVASGPWERISIRPAMPGQSGNRCQNVRGDAPSRRINWLAVSR
jgi:hypothetical protein